MEAARPETFRLANSPSCSSDWHIVEQRLLAQQAWFGSTQQLARKTLALFVWSGLVGKHGVENDAL